MTYLRKFVNFIANLKQRQMKNMFCFAAVLLSATVFFSCGPSAYLLDIETRQPSAAGVDLVGKSISVVYLDSGAEEDSLFAAGISSAFADVLDENYFGGDSLVSLFCLEGSGNEDYSSRDRMADLVVDTGSDVLFLFSSPLFEEGKAALSDGKDDAASISGTVPFTVDLFVYDSMDPRDTVLHFSGHSESSVSDLESMAGTLGRASGKRFAPGWKAEEIVFFTYGSQSWYETYYLVNGYEWKKAMDIWMTMLDTPNLEKRACLEYNIAAACYIQGDYRLAKEWLDLSQKDFRVYYSDTLMQKIEAGLAE